MLERNGRADWPHVHIWTHQGHRCWRVSRQGVGDSEGVAQLTEGSSCQTEAVLLRKIRTRSRSCPEMVQGKGIRRCRRGWRGQKQYDCGKPQACRDPPGFRLNRSKSGWLWGLSKLSANSLGRWWARPHWEGWRRLLPMVRDTGELSRSSGKLEKRRVKSPSICQRRRKKLEGEK